MYPQRRLYERAVPRGCPRNHQGTLKANAKQLRWFLTLSMPPVSRTHHHPGGRSLPQVDLQALAKGCPSAKHLVLICFCYSAQDFDDLYDG